MRHPTLSRLTMKVLMAVTLLVVADTSSAGPNLFQFDRASGTSMLLTDNLSADWFEAVGPLDRCRGGGRTTNGDQTILGNTRRSIINVCTRVRQQLREYDLCPT